MLFKIKEIGDDGLSLDLPVTAAWLASECPGLEAVPGPKGLKLRGQLTESDGDIFLNARLRGDLEGTCGRCLEKARVPVELNLTVTFMPRPEPAHGHGQAAAGRGAKQHEGRPVDDDEDEVDDVDVAHYDGDEVNLAPEIRDQILLTYPIKPLCREDCAGLCPVCGGNRNVRACACETRQATAQQPFAAALGKLKL
jgi:uncharacterized protein